MRNNKGQFTEGNRGRPVGAKSKQTAAIRERFKLLLDDNLDTLQSDLDQLSAKDRIHAILCLASYLIPKLKANDVTVEDISEKNKFRPIEIIISDENR